MSAPGNPSWSARASLGHPAWWLALALLLTNDHYLKGAGLVTPLLTGKLSDFAGMLVAPALGAAALAPRSLSAFAFAHLAVGTLFTALKLSPGCADVWCALGAMSGLTWRVVSDPSDLIALPTLGLSYWLFGARLVQTGALTAWRRLGAAAGIGVGFAASVATSRPPPPRALLSPDSVYMSVVDGLAELDRGTGHVRRSLPCRGPVSDQRRIVDEQLYSILADSVEACDLRGGRRLWKRDLQITDIISADDARVIVRGRQRVWALDRVAGSTLWEIAEPSRAAVSLKDRFALRTPDDRLEMFRSADGAKLQQARGAASDAIAFGSLIYAFQDQHLLALDESARVRGRAMHRLDGPAWALAPAWDGALFAVSPGTYRGKTTAPALVVFDASSLSERWRLPSTLLAAHNTALVFTYRASGCEGNSLDAREAAAGRSLWRIPWCPTFESAASDQTLFVSSSYEASRTRVVARDPRTGQIAWQSLLVGPPNLWDALAF